ncbi:MAG TPA: HAD family acid phosphatase [Allosphingosinicella sp.]|nr:HAD family acid phosphatase [Allosphingosinicella sp.]
MTYRIALLASIALATSAAAQPPAERPPSPPVAPSPFSTMQWLYGSGEGAATSIQAYRAFTAFVLAATRQRPRNSVILAEGSSLTDARFAPCEDSDPLAVVLDVDETVIQNLGYEYDRDVRGLGYGRYSWDRWEQEPDIHVAPMPGVADALREIRAANVTVIFNSNRLAENARHNERSLNAIGLGPASHDRNPSRRTLWLQGDTPSGSAKDERRWRIAEHFCVVAMAGDQLGDFSDLFNARTLAPPQRRAAAASAPFGAMWGGGWFMLSNPVYGPAMAGTRNEVFPESMRWLDPRGAVVE